MSTTCRFYGSGPYIKFPIDSDSRFRRNDIASSGIFLVNRNGIPNSAGIPTGITNLVHTQRNSVAVHSLSRSGNNYCVNIHRMLPFFKSCYHSCLKQIILPHHCNYLTLHPWQMTLLSMASHNYTHLAKVMCCNDFCIVVFLC